MRAKTVASRQATSAEGDAGFPPDLLVVLERSGRRDLATQLEGALRKAIRERRLTAGSTLPASRVLARQLGVARSVVVGAYGQLVAEGYLEARRGSGTRVVSSGGDPPAERVPDNGFRPRSPHLLAGLPDPASFPRVAWQRHYRAVLSKAPDTDFGYPAAGGTIELRAALADYLGRVRAVNADPQGIIICAGFAQGLTIICRTLRARGARRIAIEDPCFRYHRELITHTGLEAVPIPVRHDGIDTAELSRQDVQGVLLAPAHSFPRGAVLSPTRRTAIIAWAAQTETVLVEDDYDAEFRYDRAPIGALQGLAPENVIYGGSASKTLSPALRLGWLVAPTSLIEQLRREKFLDDMSTSTLEQLTLARMIRKGDLARQLRRMRPIYRRRRDTAVEALARHLPDATAKGVAAGLHLYVELPDGCDEARLVEAARRHGVHIQGAARSWASPGDAPPALVLGYGSTGEPAIERGIRALGVAYAGMHA